MKTKILNAIRNGYDTSRTIIPAIGAELKCKEFCKAIADLQCEGSIVYINGRYKIGVRKTP